MDKKNEYLVQYQYKGKNKSYYGGKFHSDNYYAINKVAASSADKAKAIVLKNLKKTKTRKTAKIWGVQKI